MSGTEPAMVLQGSYEEAWEAQQAGVAVLGEVREREREREREEGEGGGESQRLSTALAQQTATLARLARSALSSLSLA
eukprot:3695437-Rhodomonas_salina.1